MMGTDLNCIEMERQTIMKVLVINGSPRAKGNSDILCDEFIRGAEEAGHQVEKLSLREKNFFSL